MKKPSIWGLVKDTFVSWDEDRAPRLAAALSYYTIFALAPLLIIAIAMAALFFDEVQVRTSILEELGGLIGPSGRQAIEAMIEGARQPTTGTIATIIGVITLLVAAGGLFGQLQDALADIADDFPEFHIARAPVGQHGELYRPRGCQRAGGEQVGHVFLALGAGEGWLERRRFGVHRGLQIRLLH